MRNQLRKNNGQRLTFTAIVERFGIKTKFNGSLEETILLKDIKFTDTNQYATNHQWFTVGKTIKALNLAPGDYIQFETRVGEYVKGYINYREFIDERQIDYKLNRPTKFVKLNNITNT